MIRHPQVGWSGALLSAIKSLKNFSEGNPGHMATGNLALGSRAGARCMRVVARIVNDFSINVATGVNGSGSQSANSVLLEEHFRDGRSRERKEPCSHQTLPCLPTLVHHPRQQRRLYRAQA